MAPEGLRWGLEGIEGPSSCGVCGVTGSWARRLRVGSGGNPVAPDRRGQAAFPGAEGFCFYLVPVAGEVDRQTNLTNPDDRKKQKE